MNRTDRIWEHVDTAFGHADRAFKEADKAFAEADKLFSELGTQTTEHTPTGTVHQLNFCSRSRWERLRLTKKFFKMTCCVLFTGKARLHFRDR